MYDTALSSLPSMQAFFTAASLALAYVEIELSRGLMRPPCWAYICEPGWALEALSCLSSHKGKGKLLLIIHEIYVF